MILFLFPFCLGCSTFFSGVDLPSFPTNDKGLENIIGRRYKVAKPLVVGRYPDSWSTFLSTPMSPEDGKTIARVPEESIIVIDHVSKTHSFAAQAIGMDPKVYYYIARLENPKIYKGQFTINTFMIYEKGDFVGMDQNYLVEIHR